VSVGGVIVLNGSSSAGTTTLANTLVEQFAESGACWIVIGIDDDIGRLPPAWHRIGDHTGPFAADRLTFDLDAPDGVRVGPVGERLLAAYRSAVRDAARAGLGRAQGRMTSTLGCGRAHRTHGGHVGARSTRIASADARVPDRCGRRAP
jgi:chloramphenicol 3-O-phosphotransferase